MAKSNGGSGFRNLHGFNLALLGKHVWNFLNNPVSLLIRVFKASYFPQTNVLKASRGGGVVLFDRGSDRPKRLLLKIFIGIGRWERDNCF